MILDDFVCLRSKMYALKCGDESKNELKGISKSYSKNIKFEAHKKRLDGEEYEKECEKHLLRSVNHETCLQNIKKSSLSIFDDKRNYSGNIESLAWN